MSDDALAKVGGAQWDEATKARAHDLFQTGHTPDEIAEACLVPKRTVTQWMKSWDDFMDAGVRAREMVRIIQDAGPEQIRQLLGVQGLIIGRMRHEKTSHRDLRCLAQAYKMNVETMMDMCRCGGALAPVQERGNLNVEVTNLSGEMQVEASETTATIHLVDDVEPPSPSTAAEKVRARLAQIDDQAGRQAALKRFEGPPPVAPIDIEREKAHGEAASH